METLYKVTTPDGHPWLGDRTITYEAGRTYRRAETGPVECCTPRAIHAARTPEDAATKGRWPYILWEVEGLVVAEHPTYKVGCRQIKVVRRLPTRLCWGPSGHLVERVVDRVGRLTVAEADQLYAAGGKAAFAAARDAAWDAARAARAAVGSAALAATWDAAWDAVGDASWDVARYAARDGVGVAVGPAALAAAVADLVGSYGLTRDHLDTLTGPWRDVIGWDPTKVERLTVENGEERDVDEDTDYPCDECSTPEREVWHERAD